jgi:nicotinamidase-related amidase
MERPDIEKPGMRSALLVLDFQEGIADDTFAESALAAVKDALANARAHQVPIIFSKLGFRAGHPEVQASNRTFAAAKQYGLFTAEHSRLLPGLAEPDDLVVDKKRFSAFAGNDLTLILRAAGTTSLVLAGATTSGVVLATFLEAADDDFSMTVLADACADPLPALHERLLADLFPRSGTVTTVSAWNAADP